MRPRVYISGPITLGSRTTNFAQAATAQLELMHAGFAVLNPMLSMMHPDAWTIPHDDWLDNDFPWVAAAELIVRLPGESWGAEAECKVAREHGIPIVYSCEEALEWIKLK